MDRREEWAVGVDLGGTKVEIGQVDSDGRLLQRLKCHTNVQEGPKAVEREIVNLTRELKELARSSPVGIGVGIAGQIDPKEGVVLFAPNLHWHDVPFQSDLKKALELPVVVTNDVRAAAWGEWLHGAGEGCDDLILTCNQDNTILCSCHPISEVTCGEKIIT